MSGVGDVPMENTDITFKGMPIEQAVDNPGLGCWKSTKKILPILTHLGGWASNLPLHNKVLMAVMLFMILAVIGVRIYFATVNWNRANNCMDESFRNLLLHPFWIHNFTHEEDESHCQLEQGKELHG